MMSSPRARRAFWGDVRFLIGVALVLLSIIGVWLIVSSAKQTTAVLQANRTIAQGEVLVSGDFRVVEVGLGALVDDYLAPQGLDSGMIASRTLEQDELLPASATADASSARTTNIVVESSVGIPASVRAGTAIELWSSPVTADGEGFEAPRILSADVVVASVVENEGMLAQQRAAVEVVIDRGDVAAVLTAITDGAVLSVVPLGAES